MEEERKTKEDTQTEIILKGLISFQNFLKDFKQVVKDDIIEKKNNRFDISYNFRKFNLECYIIDKKYFDEFCKAINYKEISKILSIINEENTEKCKQIIKNKLIENNFNIDVKDIIFYADQEDLKKIVGHFNNYSFLNKEFLIYCMGVPEEKLNSKKIYVSKNEKNTTLLNIQQNFTMTINIIKKDSEKKEEEEKKEKINKKPKNIYYVDDITKKIFVLLYKKDELINKKIKKKLKCPYNFKNYYLINKEWIKLYKQNFLYDEIINKIQQEYKNYSYKRIKTELDNIIKYKIGQIKLYSKSEIEPGLKEASKLLAKIKTINENKEIKNNNINEQIFDLEIETKDIEQDLARAYDIPYKFEIIDEDIYQLLKKEEFLENFNEKIENQLCYQILFGNNQIIIKNKASEKFEDKDNYSNELLFYEKNDIKENNDDNYLLEFILNYEKKINFYEELEKIIQKGLKTYIINTGINLENNYIENIILDHNSNVLGKIFNVNINFDKINMIDNKNDEIQNDIYNICDEDKIQNINEIQHIEINISKNKKSNKNNYNYINSNLEKKENLEKNKYHYNEISKERKIIILNIYNSLINSIYFNRKFFSEFNLNRLSEDELENIFKTKRYNDNFYEIILMDEDKYNTFKNKYNFDELNNIFNTFKTNNVLNRINKNIKMLNFLNFIDVKENKLKIDKKFILNYNYESCLENINKNKNFVLLNSEYFPKISENDSIYYFLHKNKPYIFFRKEKKILKVKIKNDNENGKNLFCNLFVYNIDNKNKVSEYLQSLKELMNDFKNNKFEKRKKLINEYYLINDNWINYAENLIKNKDDNYIKESFNPTNKHDSLNFEYPINFFIVRNDEKNKLMLETLIKNFNINHEEINIKKISIIENDKIYICVIIDNIAYFYQNEIEKEKENNKKKLNLFFLIKFSNKNIIEKEIIEITETGVVPYINLRIFNHNEPYKLIDINLNEIGNLFLLKDKKNIIKLEINNSSFMNAKNINMNCEKLHSFLICMIKIINLEDLILIKNNLNLKLNTDFFSNFCKVLGIIKRNYTKFLEQIISEDKREKIKNEYEEVYDVFISQVQELSNEEDKNIFDNMSLLIKKIILKLQKELYKFKCNDEFNYDDKKFLNENIKINNDKTIFQKLFFFEIEISKKNCSCQIKKLYQLKYYLEFYLNDKDENSMEIISLFNKLKRKEKCSLCGKELEIKESLISLPEYLIIIVYDTNKTITTKPSEKIDIKPFCNNMEESIIEYELIILTNEVFNPIIKFNKQKKVIWMKGSKSVDFKINRKMPNLLIYKKVKGKSKIK